MLGYEWFSSTIMNRGLDYYKRGRVILLKKEKNGYSATVRGSQKYHVFITMSGNEVTTMKCDCPYAEDGKHCKHEASVLYAIEDEISKQFKEQTDQLTLAQVYLEMQIKYRYVYRITDEFKKEVNRRIKKIMDQSSPYHQNTVSELSHLLDQFIEIKYSNTYRNDIFDLFFKQFRQLRVQNKSYGEDVTQWLIKSLSESIKEIPIRYYFNLIKNYKESEQVKIYMKILLSMKYDSREHQNLFLSRLYSLLNKNKKVEATVIINRLQQFENLEFYQKMVARELMKQEKYKEAKESIDEFKQNHLMIDEKIFKDLEDELFCYTADKKEYALQVIQNLRKRNYTDFSEMMKLKNMYGKDWELENFDILKEVESFMNPYYFKQLLEETESNRYVVSYVLENPTMSNFENFKNIIENYDKDTYLFLFGHCIRNEALESRSHNDHHFIQSCLYRLQGVGCSLQGIQELIYKIQEDNPGKKALNELLDKVLESQVEGDGSLYGERVYY